MECLIWPPVSLKVQNCKLCTVHRSIYCVLFDLLTHKERINLLRTSWYLYNEFSNYLEIYYEIISKKNREEIFLPQIYYPFKNLVFKSFPSSFDFFKGFDKTKHVTIKNTDDDLNGVFDGVLDSFKNIKGLTVDFTGRYDKEGLDLLDLKKDIEEISKISKFADLEELTINLCNKINFKINDEKESIAYIFKMEGLQKLKYLKIDISHCDMYNSELKIILEFIERCKEVEYLDLNLENNEITFQGLEHFNILKNSKIEKLKLNLSFNAIELNRISDIIVLNKYKNLYDLELDFKISSHYFRGREFNLSFLNSFDNLLRLSIKTNLKNNYFFHDDSFNIIGRNLVELELILEEKITFDYISFFYHIYNNKQLKKLTLTIKDKPFSFAGINYIVECVSKNNLLEELELNLNGSSQSRDSIKENYFSSIFSKELNLKKFSLKISGSHIYTNEDELIKIIDSFRNYKIDYLELHFMGIINTFKNRETVNIMNRERMKWKASTYELKI